MAESRHIIAWRGRFTGEARGYRSVCGCVWRAERCVSIVQIESGRVKQEFVNPFLTSAKLVWEKELGMSVELTSASSVDTRFLTEDITASIGLSGQLVGTVLYGFPNLTAREIMNVMVGEEVESDSELAQSALGELANMVAGNAATLLSNAGYTCDISPPIIITATGTIISTLGRPQLKGDFSSDVGPMSIRIDLSESPNHR